MRNLSLFSTEHASFSYANTNWTATALDLDENVLYAASERTNRDGEVEVELWRASQDKQSNLDVEVSPIMASVFTSTISSSSPATSQIVSLRVIAELRKIAAIMRGGDVVMVPIDKEDAPAGVEGTFESGILAASWSPDESLLAIVTGEQKLILMTSTFDVLSEHPLNPQEFGEDAPINVGWGSKQTQFHGSLGKTAAHAPTNVKIGSSPDDDNVPRISWRGDGAFFVVSSVLPPDDLGFRRRSLRVYDRQAILQSTSEPVAGFEHALVWRPSGNLIVGTQRFGFEGGGAGRGGRHDVIFFERNGLRHGEFTLISEHFMNTKSKEVDIAERKWGYKVRELLWSSDSNVLGVWVESDGGDIVQLWTTGNYHWYLKHEIAAPALEPGRVGRFTSVEWHPESPLHLILTTQNEVIQRRYVWETYVSPSTPPSDSGLVAVLDGSTILLTPFRTQNIPPPMSSYQLRVSPSQSPSSLYSETRIPIYVAFSSENDAMAVLWESGYVDLWALHTRIGPGSAKVMNPSKIWEGTASDLAHARWRQVSLYSLSPTGLSWTITLLGAVLQEDSDILATLHLENGKLSRTGVAHLPSRNCRNVRGGWPQSFQSPNGEVYQHDPSVDGSHFSIVTRFPEFCSQTQTANIDKDQDGRSSATLFFGLGKSGKLYGTASNNESRILASNASSFTIASTFVVFTTTAHETKYVPLNTISAILLADRNLEEPIEIPDRWDVRKVERGSRIVVAVPSTMSLVLQMPRGNLETINPRPLVMEVVKQDLDGGNYRKAFFSCRKHRIDLNVLVDHDEDAFLQHIPSFVDQIHEVDHLNLFLTIIGRGSQSAETTAKICDAIRIELEGKDMKRYINSILTAHVVKTPPGYEAGLGQLLRLRETDPSLVEEAVKYIIFLVDAERLFDIALGMYDFSLVLMIAQHAQKDPREYLPFLRGLRALDQYYQRFRIDDHLKRYESALKNLSLAGEERFPEAIAYIERHHLYESALSIWKASEHHHDVLELYGDWLYERREFPEAATAFVEAHKPLKAMVAYEKNLDWQELFDLACLSGVAGEEIVAMGYRVAEDLSSKKRHTDAGRVLLDYAKDVRQAVNALVQGNAFSESRRIANLNSRHDLLQEVIHPAALESRALISEEISEMRDQLRKQLHRIRELRIRKIEEPDAFYGTEDLALQNIDVMTDVSMPFTAFTRYTVAPTTASRSSKRSSRSKRKAERKVGSGRKGTVDEEEYLLKSVTKLFEKFIGTQGEARNLLPHLYQFSAEHRGEGLELQSDVASFETELKAALDEIWPKPDDANEPPQADTWATRMAEQERNRLISPTDKVPKPDASQGKKWRMNLLDLP